MNYLIELKMPPSFGSTIDWIRFSQKYRIVLIGTIPLWCNNDCALNLFVFHCVFVVKFCDQLDNLTGF